MALCVQAETPEETNFSIIISNWTEMYRVHNKSEMNEYNEWMNSKPLGRHCSQAIKVTGEAPLRCIVLLF